jgi:hypothetical protein
VSDGRIYATTYKKVDGRREMIVLDLEGRILRRVYLPLTSIRPERGVVRYDLFTVSGGKLYELVQTAGKDTWELVVTDLEAVSSPPRAEEHPAPSSAWPTSKFVRCDGTPFWPSWASSAPSPQPAPGESMR